MHDARAERLTLTQAAARLGVAPDTIRRRIKRGDLTATKDNRGRYLVLVPPREAAGPPPTQDHAALVAELRRRVDSLERRLDEAQAERRQLVALVERLSTPRPWPGLRAWWRKVLYGE